MKKIFYSLMMLGAVAGLSSCSSEEPMPVENDGTIAFSIKLPMNSTRAYGDTTNCDQLTYTIYDADNNIVVSDQTIEAFGYGVTVKEFQIKLVKNQEYNIVFYANNSESKFAEYEEGSITVHYDKLNVNNEIDDAFYACVNVVSDGTTHDVTLYRPFAQINVGTNDLDAPVVQNIIKKIKTTLNFDANSLYQKMNLMTNEVSDPLTTEQSYSNMPAQRNELFPVQNYSNLLSVYILVPGVEGTLFNGSLQISKEAAAPAEGEEGSEPAAPNYILNKSLTDVPCMMNHRTNIYGSLITSDEPFKIIIEPAFDKPDYSEEPWTGASKTPVINDATKTGTITSEAELAGLRDLVAQGNDYKGYTFTLTNDLDLDNVPWTPIAQGVCPQKNTREAPYGNEYTGNTFAGTFDGNGKTIKNVNIPNMSGIDAVNGMFGAVSGTVKNFTVENLKVSQTDESYTTGGVVGLLHDGGTVENVTVKSGNVSGYRGVGAVVGRILLDGTVSNCSNAASVNGEFFVGGIVGAACNTAEGKKMTISDCSNTADITSKGYCAGIVGTSNGFIEGCTNSGTITGNSSTSVGGIVGEQDDYGAVKNCVNTGNITGGTGSYGHGGIIGWIRYYTNVESSQVKAMIEVSGNTNYGSVTSGNDAGGIVGTCYNFGNIHNNYNYAPELQAKTFAAGIVGNAQFENTVPGMNMEDRHINVVDNESSTTLEQMTVNGTCKSLFVYNNTPNTDMVTNEGNKQVDPKPAPAE